ncbi:DNA polymerase III subunit chi [Alphaproteobacteria bacterium]|nr:DNA polymerase III subunit chi [Alphaproteobacteria bacterium]
MPEVRFYHLTRTPLERVLPTLLEKTLERGKRAVVLAENEQQTQDLNALLWSYSERSFLPHGSKAEGDAERQPIWITDESDAPNGATYAFMIGAARLEDPAVFEMSALIFDGDSDHAVSLARESWKTYKDRGLEISYWQQNERGSWEQKA